MEAGEAFLRIEGEEFLQQAEGLGTRASQGGVDRAEDRRELFGLVKLEQPAADLSAAGANGEQVKELLVLVRCPVCGEQVPQGGGIEMSVLHAILR